MVQQKYFSDAERHTAKKKNALNTYYRKVARDADFINKKKAIRLILSDRLIVDQVYTFLQSIEPVVNNSAVA
tara:strand:+ start:78 stop:293 length:216 start_codon:yes stop_codon:yes gene_type:complete